KAGVVMINNPFSAFPGLPFGGYKQSGFGRELAIESLDLYTETKSVLSYIGSKPLNPFGVCGGAACETGTSSRSSGDDEHHGDAGYDRGLRRGTDPSRLIHHDHGILQGMVGE